MQPAPWPREWARLVHGLLMGGTATALLPTVPCRDAERHGFRLSALAVDLARLFHRSVPLAIEGALSEPLAAFDLKDSAILATPTLRSWDLGIRGCQREPTQLPMLPIIM
ncbi:unnamed protein product [Effrenium voratum]|nr:unnamed protein product [Effrenium voratum]